PDPTPADHHELDRSRGDHRGVPRRGVDDGQLAEVVARAEGGDLDAATGDGQLAVDHHPELLAGCSLPDDPVASRVPQVVGLTHDHVQLTLGQCGEQRDGTQPLDVQVLAHAAAPGQT